MLFGFKSSFIQRGENEKQNSCINVGDIKGKFARAYKPVFFN